MTKFLGLALLAAGTIAYSQSHHDDVNRRGDHEMGFSHEKTTHHFRLAKDGGAIEVTANDPNDTESRDQIRQHLTHIAMMFSAGNFNAPMLIHDQTPPGVPVMKRLKSQIKYEFENMESGGRVKISTSNREAIDAVHEFLRFQITDHQTGDPLTL
jgi:TusA-related sulfurtransferase